MIWARVSSIFFNTFCCAFDSTIGNWPSYSPVHDLKHDVRRSDATATRPFQWSRFILHCPQWLHNVLWLIELYSVLGLEEMMKCLIYDVLWNGFMSIHTNFDTDGTVAIRSWLNSFKYRLHNFFYYNCYCHGDFRLINYQNILIRCIDINAVELLVVVAEIFACNLYCNLISYGFFYIIDSIEFMSPNVSLGLDMYYACLVINSLGEPYSLNPAVVERGPKGVLIR